MRRSIVALSLVTVAVLAAPPAGAQPGPPGGRGPHGRAARIYDPKTVETVTGDVVEVQRVRAGRGGGGVHLVVRTGAGTTIAVHLGPAWYVDRQRITIAPKDHVEVRGSRVRLDGTEAIIAAEVKKGADTLVLRDAAGVPAWRGARP